MKKNHLPLLNFSYFILSITVRRKKERRKGEMDGGKERRPR